MNRLHFTLPNEPRRVWQEVGFVQAPTEDERIARGQATDPLAATSAPSEPDAVPEPIQSVLDGCHGASHFYDALFRNDTGPIARAQANEPEDWPLADADPTWHRRSSDIDPLKRAFWYGACWGFCVGILTTLGLLVAVGRLG
jgi:hypothetical protein